MKCMLKLIQNNNRIYRAFSETQSALQHEEKTQCTNQWSVNKQTYKNNNYFYPKHSKTHAHTRLHVHTHTHAYTHIQGSMQTHNANKEHTEQHHKFTSNFKLNRWIFFLTAQLPDTPTSPTQTCASGKNVNDCYSWT